MSDKTPANAKSSPDPAPKKGGLLKKLILLFMALAIVGGGAAGGFLWWQGQSAHAEGAEAPPPAEPNAVLPLEPFVVNLSDQAGSRFLRVNLRLLLLTPRGQRDLKALIENEVVMARLRSALLELLSTKTADELVTAEGKDELKREIVAQAAGILSEVEVRDVLFSEFVVQF